MENLALVSSFTICCLFFRVLAYFSVPLLLRGLSVVFLRSHPDLLQTIEEAEQRHRLTPPESSSDKAKDQVIAALRRRLEAMKQKNVSKHQELRGKPRQIAPLSQK